MERLEGTIQPYGWGSTDALAAFMGTVSTGQPQAELWLGAHPSAPARIGDVGLDVAIARDPEGLVGPASVAEYGPRLPYLLKVLAVERPLSLQAHPNRAQAEEGFSREDVQGIPRDAPNRTYRDDWPKPEALCALGDFEALCGFREPAETYALFERLGVPGCMALVEPLRSRGVEGLATVFERLLRLPDGDLAVIDDVVAAGKAVATDGDLGVFARTAVELAAHYPADRGILAALLMNRLAYRRNQAVYLPPGNLHAYLRGIGVEIMANSDNVLRGGLTPKHVDVPELMKSLDFTPGYHPVMDGIEQAPGVFAYPTPVPEFALWRLETGSEAVQLPAEGTGRVVLAAGGTVTLRCGDQRIELTQGQSVFVRAVDAGTRVEGEGTLFVAAPGIDGADQMTHQLNTGLAEAETADV
ncbi:MAG TPA: mannose-6-phosphate isomerase, class I [Propionibacteriaceae bacterium]|nr:mannose-6-phosphate isomerase, class I [Propionibacteriaceae bacterium]